MAMGDGTIDAALAKKYEQMARQVASEVDLKRMQGGLLAYQADPNSLQNRKIGAASTTGTNELPSAQAGAARMQTALSPGIAQSEIARNYAGAAAPYMQNDLGLRGLGLEAQKLGAGLMPVSQGQLDQIRNAYGWGGSADGSANIQPGAQPPPKGGDVVPTMLTPGEAVLTPQAAEILGRPVIELLNALGKVKTDVGGGGLMSDAAPPEAAPKKGAKPATKAA